MQNVKVCSINQFIHSFHKALKLSPEVDNDAFNMCGDAGIAPNVHPQYKCSVKQSFAVAKNGHDYTTTDKLIATIGSHQV